MDPFPGHADPGVFRVHVHDGLGGIFPGLDCVHSKYCGPPGVKITPPGLIEDHTMHFTPVLNLRC